MTRQMKAPLLLSAVALLLVASCQKPAGLDRVSLRGKPYDLLPPDKAVPIDLTRTEFEGTCSEQDRLGIAKCLGRIPATFSVKKIWIAWSEKPLAARVRIYDSTFFLRRSDSGEWQLVGEVLLIPDQPQSSNGAVLK